MRYPDAPGYKARDTSASAANEVEPRAKTLRYKVMKVIASRKNATADECAEILKESILSIRPRLSELAANGLISDSCERRKNASGKNAIAWQLAERQPRFL